VKKYVATKNASMPPGYRLTTWQDTSIDVRDRMDLLIRNGTQGLILVFFVLAVFLDLRLAFWVAIGIPIAVLGAAAVLYLAGQTLNMLSMFAFLLALGIVVDDAIVIGENVYSHRQRGQGFIAAAIEGTYEVLPSVTASVGTTIIAFMPLMYVSGVMGKFIAVMPLAVIAMLLISLFEATFVLPCHLAHQDSLLFKVLGIVLYPLRPVVPFFHWLTEQNQRLLNWLIENTYVPTIRRALRHPGVTISLGVAVLIFSFGLIRSGITPFVLFPKLDSNVIEAKIAFADGTPMSVTDEATRRIEQAFMRVHQRFAADGQPIGQLVHRAVGETTGAGSLGPDSRSTGGNVGGVYVELYDTAQRSVTSEQILKAWREEALRDGAFLGVERLTFGTPNFGPGGAAIEFKLLAPPSDFARLEQAVEESKARLAEYPGVFDIRDDSVPGKWEYQLRVKDKAVAMGVTAADLAETVRATYYGDEVMRLQRGRHEVKLMVRYPEPQRRSLADFDQIRIRTGDGAERPLTEVADVRIERSNSEINRIEQLRSITITADVDESEGNAYQIVENFRAGFMTDLAKRFPFVKVRWEGQKEQSNESVRSLMRGFAAAIFAMFCLLTLEFRSYFQPFLILLIIPFGFVGAIWGHAFLGIPITLFSMFGLVALTGVVVNDSIVLIDFINHHLRDGMPMPVALVEAGRRRFRPVLMTSFTTIAGLTPMLLETSFQAQVLIPMAASLSFGLLASTAIVLVMLPVTYSVYARLMARLSGIAPTAIPHEEALPAAAMPQPVAAGD
jgi:HAE1 family hydrophobic/amphiphilic exporter-1